MKSIIESLQKISTIEELAEIEKKENKTSGSLLIEIKPKNAYGHESIFIIEHYDHVTLSFDYYERIFRVRENPHKEMFEEVVSLVKKILDEDLISVTTYSYDINLSKVSNLDTPSELKRRSRRKNFRSRSWLGTYDDDCV